MHKTSLVFAMLVLGCAAGGGGIRYYGVTSATAQAVPEFREALPLSDQARAELKRGDTVAFFPPDRCLERSATPSGSIQDQQVLHTQCGVVMTELERAAMAAGYQVVSWQSLRGSNRPVQYAKAQKVAVLFEINELGTTDVSDRDSSQALDFFEVQGPQRFAPVRVDRSVGDRCRAAMQGAQPAIVGLSATLDVKMVSVAHERVLWTYRNTRAMDMSRSQGTQYYVAHESTYKKKRWPWALIGIGVSGAGLGLADNMEPTMIGIGAGVALIGAIGVLTEHHTTTWQTPSQVVCATPSVPDPYAPALVPAPAPVAEENSHFETHESTRNRDPLAESRLKLTRELVGDFMRTLQGES